MKSVYFILLPILLLCSTTEAAECEDGWVAFKDELCIKSFPNLLSYDESRDFCESQGDQVAKASLVMVKEEELQELLSTYTNEIYDYLWLGGKYDNTSGEFKWDDGEPLTYTNWQEGYPRNNTGDAVCIELRPLHATHSINSAAKWADANCQSRKLVMCQKTLSWTLKDAIAEIIKNRKQLEHAAEDREDLRQQLETVRSQVVPVGSIYIEYSGQPSPRTLWPTLTWDDITATYAGLFFRASGGGSAGWGAVQAECSPRISQVDYAENKDEYPTPVNLPTSGWSAYAGVGRWFSEGRGTWEGVRFNVANCEVRPKNQAIRVWKRTT